MNQNRWRPSPLQWGLLASLGLHVFVLAWQAYLAATERMQTRAKAASMVEIAPLPPEIVERMKRERQKVRSKEAEIAETEDAIKKEDPNARFLSDRNQVAEKEMRARDTDDFRKKAGTGNTKAGATPAGSVQTGNPDAPSEKSPVVARDGAEPSKTAKGVKRDWKTLSLRDLSVGGDGGIGAATDDKLDGVAIGDKTVLSTREFKFYSYYHRIKELLRQYWKPNVERKLAMMWNRGKAVRDEELVTRVLVLLDDNGGISKISKLGSSGFPDLDDAAVEAFNRAGPFPNPPKGMVDADGFVRIRWDFILKTEAGPRIQFRPAGAP